MDWIYAKGIPIEAQYLFRKGLEMAAHGQQERALVYFKQAVFLAPRYSNAIFEMGNCLARLGRIKEAMEKYSRAAGIDPHYAKKIPAASGMLQEWHERVCSNRTQAFCSTG